MKNGLLLEKDVKELQIFVKDIQADETLQENERIIRNDKQEIIKGGFRKLIEKTPINIKDYEEKGYFLEIALRHKQRAVGLQAMVYLCVYVNKLEDIDGKTLIGRPAREKEFAIYRITQGNRDVILDTVRAFAIASIKHKYDMKAILEQVRGKYGNRG